MNKILIVVIVGCFSAMLVESFLFPHKYKDACDPDPCKHSGKCVLDPRNKNISTCTCTADYHGKHCEHEMGCKKKPCKNNAPCTNGILNKTEYYCKCSESFVGKNCDKKNLCLKSNPCKNGKCVIEKVSGDTICECQPGWASKYCDKHECNITEFKMKHATKKSPKIFIDKEIETKMKELDQLASLCKVHLHIVRSYVQHPEKTKAHTYDIKDRTNCQHYIGQAITAHIYDPKDNLLCNDVCMAKVPCPVPAAKCFLDGLYAIKWKWSILDACTFHTDYHHAHGIVKYNHHRQAVQVGCESKKFA